MSKDKLQEIAKELANNANMPYCWEDIYNRLIGGYPLPFKVEVKQRKTIQKGIFMKSKKITVIISYDYEDKNTVSNDRIADRVKNDLLKGSNPNHEKIESVTVEDN